jgi:hypothetical protein
MLWIVYNCRIHLDLVILTRRITQNFLVYGTYAFV